MKYCFSYYYLLTEQQQQTNITNKQIKCITVYTLETFPGITFPNIRLSQQQMFELSFSDDRLEE